MSNDFSGNPIVLDDFSSAIDVGNSMFGNSYAMIKVEKIIWSKPTSLSHTLTMTDATSRPLAEAQCGQVSQVLKVCEPGWFGGIKIAASGVESGKALIYLDQAQ